MYLYFESICNFSAISLQLFFKSCNFFVKVCNFYAILYLQSLSNVTLKKNALGAINQIKNMNYYLELKQLDIKKILLYFFVFDDTKNIIEYEMI